MKIIPSVFVEEIQNIPEEFEAELLYFNIKSRIYVPLIINKCGKLIL